MMPVVRMPGSVTRKIRLPRRPAARGAISCSLPAPNWIEAVVLKTKGDMAGVPLPACLDPPTVTQLRRWIGGLFGRVKSLTAET